MRRYDGVERRQRNRRVSHDRWLVSYADFITLLFAFFAMMYAVSSVDAKKLEVAANGLRAAFADTAKASSTDASVVTPEDVALAPAGSISPEEIEEALRRSLGTGLEATGLSLRIGRRGVILSIPEAGAFSTGDDELSPVALELVGQVASAMTEFPNAVRVEGHADNLPINTVRFRSNWDLSAARASRVVELLIRGGVEPSRLAATGYAEFQPRMPNEDEAARAANRRVDLVILNQASDMPEPPTERQTL